MAKPSVEFLMRLRGATGAALYVWTWDLIDYAEDRTRRAWFNAAIPLVRAAFLNEVGRERMWRSLGGRVEHVNDGSVAISDRGPGRRPAPPLCSSSSSSSSSLWDSGPDVVFVGSVQGNDTSRVAPIKALLAAGVDVRVHGPEEQWALVGVASAGEVWSEEAAAVEASAKVVLSFSRPSSSLWLYRSDRLLRSTAAGAAVVTYPFRGIDLMLPPGALLIVKEGGQEGGGEEEEEKEAEEQGVAAAAESAKASSGAKRRGGSPQEAPSAAAWSEEHAERVGKAVVAAVKALLVDRGARQRLRRRAQEATWAHHTWEDSVGIT
jgi:hypothetical protein